MLTDAQGRGVGGNGDESASRLDRDGLLAKALQRREPAAAELLVTTYGDRAYRLARGIAGSAQDAEEVVQDAFWTVVRKIDTFRGESAFGSWFYRIVANAAYQKLRSTRTAGTRRRSPTGLRAWMTHLARPNCAWR